MKALGNPNAVRNSRMLAGVALSGMMLALVGCNSALPDRVQAGGSFLFNLETSDERPVGFGSALGGADVQRGSVAFSLCPEAQRCAGSERAFALETQLISRVGVDAFSPAGLAGAVELPRLGLRMPVPGTAVALLRVPSRAAGGPPPGRYRVQAHATSAWGELGADLLGEAGGTVEVLPGAGEPVPVPMAGVMKQLVPLPRITLTARIGDEQASTGPAAAEILVRFPEGRARLRGAAPAGGPAPSAMVVLGPGPEPDTARIALMAPDRQVLQLGIAFELAPGVTEPLQIDEFEIVAQTLYDARGSAERELRFTLEDRVL